MANKSSSGFKKISRTFLFFCLVLFSFVLGVESFGLFQKRYPGSPREVRCSQSSTNEIKICLNGKYIDDCNRESCFKGIGEKCSPSTLIDSNGGTQYGQCAEGLQCVCNKCLGCIKDQCRLELESCKNRNNFFYNGMYGNSIQSYYDTNDNGYSK